ncbi:MAG: preprotein translocase subunit SecG [Bacillota bacterium]|jgi:preprotein translocase subunit SecG|nr:preprotein translocase subunit SecG [Bacillota bacterium]HHT90431.1 preprotein translocase subunit SecG [Bacillota bacterium]
MGTFLMIIQFIVCIALIVAVVLQESKGEGLGSIGGGSRMFFNQRKGSEEILSTATTYLAVGFLVLSVVLSVWF